LYVRDLVDDRTTLVTRGASLGGIGKISISDDARYVAFASWSADLVANDTNGVGDIFVRAYPTPVVRSVDPALVPHGTSTKMTVIGDGFAPSPKVNVSGVGVSVTSVKAGFRTRTQSLNRRRSRGGDRCPLRHRDEHRNWPRPSSRRHRRLLGLSDHH
jgi:hypothetical protein